MVNVQPQRSNDALVRVVLPLLAYALIVLMAVAGTYLGWVNRLTPEVPPSFGARPAHLLAALAAGSVGVFLAARARQNVVGWTLLTLGLLGGGNIALDTYAGYALHTRPGLPGGVAAAWVFNWLWVPLLGVTAIWFPLVFPDGRLVGRAWRRVLILGAVATAFATVAVALRAGPLDPYVTVENPLALEGVPLAVSEMGMLPVTAIAGFAVASQFVRYRRASEDQRHQIKWVALAAATIALLFAAVSVVAIRAEDQAIPQPLATTLVLAIALLPLSTAIAVLRYRLYDIDIILNRTLVYVPLTAALAGLYVAMSGLLRTILTDITDQGSEAAVAMSTLMIVAALTPAKNKLQTLVDLRFKEAPDPQKALRGLTDQARSFADLADRNVLLPRYLEALTTAFNSGGASVELAGPATSPTRIEQGAVVGTPALQSEMRAGTTSLGMLHLYPRNDGRPYTPAEEETLHASVESISRVMGLVRPTE